MNAFRLCEHRTSALLLLAVFGGVWTATAQGQIAGVVATGSRYAGNSTGTPGYSSDSGTASSTTLNAPSYAVFDPSGNLFVSDTQNNCVRKIDTAGNITTVAGLRVNGGPDTCNAALAPAPTTAQGLYMPAGLAIDSAGTLYIADSMHHCVRTLAAGVVDSFAANALGTAAGTCNATDTNSVTPMPNGLAIDGSGDLFISVQDTLAPLPVSQVVERTSGSPATSVCLLAGQPSANVASACTGVSGTATLSGPSGIALDPTGNLFFADTGNNCVRELAGLTTLQTAVGRCTGDGTGSASTALTSPYGLAFTPGSVLLITQSALTQSSLVSFSASTNTLTPLAGLPSGTPGPYTTLLDGQSALSTPLNLPRGVVTDPAGNIFLADTSNNVVRRLSTNLAFGSGALGSTGSPQTVTFAINQASNLSATVGADYAITTNTCAGLQVATPAPLPPATCQVTLTFDPTRPGVRTSALQLKDAISGGVVSAAVSGTGVGPLSLLTPGVAGTLAGGLRSPLGISVDSSGNVYVLEQGDAATSSDVLFYPAGGGSPQVIVPQGSGVNTPTAMTVDGAGNIYIADGSTNTVARFGADGSVNLSYVTGLTFASALAVDNFGNLYVAQAGSTHNVIEVYAGGARRVIAGSGSTPAADGVAASTAQFNKPSGLALAPNGNLSIADATGQYVYTIDSTGTIHIVAGNGTSISTNPAQATGTGLLYPVGLAYDAAGDLYIADNATDRIFEVLPIQSSGSNITSPFGSGASGNTGDGGPATAATLFEPFNLALDGSSNLYVTDFGNNAVRTVTYPTVSHIDFGHVTIGNPSTKLQGIANVGNAPLSITTPLSVTNSPPYSISSGSTTCSSSLSAGGVCNIAFVFNPIAIGPVNATSIVTSNAYDSPQTINLTAFGITTQILPDTLPPETEVYGQPFNQSVNLSIPFPDLTPTGTISFSVGLEQTCHVGGPFASTVNCAAQESGLGVLNSPYQVNYSYVSGDINYFNNSGTTTLTVTPASLSVNPASFTRPYGASNPTQLNGITFSGTGTLNTLANGDVVLLTETTTATSASPIGVYPVTPTLTPVGLASLSNYTITYSPATLTIAAAPLTVTINSVSRPYGAANPTFTYTIVGAQNGDTFTVTPTTTATTTSGVGTYPITATVTGANIAQYAVTVVPGVLTVTPIALTVNVANASRPYGAANPTFTSAIVGAINGDTFTQNLTTTAAINSPVGTYPINDVLSGPAAANYTITVNPGTLTITPAVVTLNVTANNATRLYGAANPAFSSTVTGLLNGDTVTITYTTTATVTSPVGAYPIVPAVSGPAAANYTVVTGNGTLTITPAPLTITAANATRVYNTANPVFTGTLTGILNGDTVTATYTTAATQTSPVGTYPIVPSVSGAAAANYTVTPVNGTLTITAQVIPPLVVTVNNATRAYGAANPIFTGTVTGLVNGDTVAVVYSSAANPTSAPGTYPITATVSGAAAANYTIQIIPGVLTVTQAATSTSLTTSGSPIFSGGSVTFTATVTAGAGLTPGGMVTFTSVSTTGSQGLGTTTLGTATLNSSGVATFTTSSLPPGNFSITAIYGGATDFLGSSGSVIEAVSPGSFTLAATPASQFVRGAGTTTYTITATSTQSFTGPVTLTCAGLPSDATCNFATPILTLTANGTATTSMTVTNTAADARLIAPEPPSRSNSHLAPIAFALVFPFELTGLGLLVSGSSRRRRIRLGRKRLLLAVVCTASLMGLAGCACFTSIYQNYTINVTGTTSVSGVASQSTTVILSVGQPQ